MAPPYPQLLVEAARRSLNAGSGGRAGRGRGLRGAACLQLAAEVLAVARGLKPAVLHDGGAEPEELRDYLEALRGLGLPAGGLHVLGLGDHCLVLSPERARRHLLHVLAGHLAFVDVSGSLPAPRLCSPQQRHSLEALVSDLQAHLQALPCAPGTAAVTCSHLQPADWNLCTVFGILLGYPAPYTFDLGQGGDNCLALTPLRVFTVHTSWLPARPPVLLYSFSVPESLHPSLQGTLDRWEEDLRTQWCAQSDFGDLNITSEIVTLPAVAL